MTTMWNMVAGTALLGVSTAVCGQCDLYEIEPFRTPFCPIGGYRPVSPLAINEQGEIVGYFWNCNSDNRAFRWSGGPTLTPLPNAAGVRQSRAYDINRLGQIVGYRELTDPLATQVAFVFQNGFYTDLESLPGTRIVEAVAINDLGDACGTMLDPATGPLFGFVWRNGRLEVLKTPLGPEVSPKDINDHGQVVGWMGEGAGPPFKGEAFLWQDGAAQSLGIPKGGIRSEAVAINDQGEIAGHYFIETAPKTYRRRGFIWRDGTFTDIGLLPGIYDAVFINDMNERGEIVGFCTVGNQNTGVPVIWKNGVTRSLAELAAFPAGVILQSAVAINNQGQIAIQAHEPGVGLLAYRMTPVPPIPGDFDCSRSVNVDDLLGVLSHWNFPGGTADFNDDGTVNLPDLMIVIENWTN